MSGAAAGNMLTYWYGVVAAHAPDAPAQLAGLEGAQVRAVEAAGLRAVVSDVPSAEYGEAALDEKLMNLEWAGQRGVAHERVLTWFADHTPVVPLAPFSLHQSDERVRERLEETAALFRRALDRVAGHREWIIRVWRLHETFARAADDSPPLRALTDEARAASPGRRHLLEKKLAGARTDAIRRMSAERASEIFDAVRAAAADAQRLPVAPQPPESRTAGGRTLLLAAAFFVHQDRYADFERAVQAEARNADSAGLQWEFTGPWPPYHFAAIE